MINTTEENMFTEKDLNQIQEKGINLEVVNEQIRNFERGFDYLNIQKPATIGDGIIKLSEEEIDQHETNYPKTIQGKKLLKFVPASGAATRMFKALLEFKNNLTAQERFSMDEMERNRGKVYDFFNRIIEFPLYEELYREVAEKTDERLNELLEARKYIKILDAAFSSRRLDFSNTPKGLIHFHRYGNGELRTPVQEHMIEGSHYAKNEDGSIYIHFTVLPDHMDAFKKVVDRVTPIYEERYGVKYNISFSVQKQITDTIAVTHDNLPFREKNGSILFRPGGHGALLSNLDDLEADIIFIKNIDNVTTDRLKSDTYRYKKLIASILIQTQHKVFDYLNRIDEGENSPEFVEELNTFFEKTLCNLQPPIFKNFSIADKLQYFHNKLDRPIRVCGMVKNEGEPGGGPFWAVNPDDTVSLQIVESAQIDLKDEKNQELVKKASHFNPVDLVCSTRDYKGEKFDLMMFRDTGAGFITHKSRDGREVKAQELPGLWNGSMSDWNTLFVEVPVSTFTPVKTVNDLLRNQHKAY